MPVDRKRINGPEESVPYELFARLRPKSLQKKDADEQVKQFNAETDGIQHKTYLQTGIVSQAKGSSYIEIGKTKVIVSVFDPREIPNRVDYGLKGEISCEFKFAPFSCRKRRLHQQDDEEKLYSRIMKKALESAVCLHELPNFQVDIHSVVLENDGSALSGAIIAAGIALAEAGVPMYDLITSVTLWILPDGKLVEPTLSKQLNHQVKADDDTNINCGMLVVSKLHTHQQICQFYQSGYISQDKVKNSIKVLSKSCDALVPLVQKCLVKGVIGNIKS